MATGTASSSEESPQEKLARLTAAKNQLVAEIEQLEERKRKAEDGTGSPLLAQPVTTDACTEGSSETDGTAEGDPDDHDTHTSF